MTKFKLNKTDVLLTTDQELAKNQQLSIYFQRT